MSAAGNILIGGVITGAIYALLAVGYSLVFSVSGALNLAQGAFVAFGALVMYSFTHNAGLPVPVAFVASLAVVCAAVGIIEWTVIRPAVTRISHSNLLMMMGGLLTAFQGAAFLIWGSTPISVSQFSGTKPVTVGGLSIPTQGFWVIGAMLAAVAALSLVLMRTRLGRGLRATSENITAARLMGVPVDRMILLSFVAAAGLGVIGGAVIAPLTSLDYSSMATYTNEGLIAVSLGGLGSVYGAAAGGLVLGIVEAVVSGYVSSLFSTTISLIILIGIIFFRPQGLLGRARGRRMDVAERTAGRVYAPPKLPRRVLLSGSVVVVAVMAFLPDIIPSGDMRAVNITGIFCLTIIGLDLLSGIAGQVSLGQAGFMAIGGYMTAILTTRYHVPTLLALLAGVAGSALVAILLGLVCGRLRGMYLAITTLAFGILIEGLANGLSITGGPSGIGGIPPLTVGSFQFDTDNSFFYLIWIIVGGGAGAQRQPRAQQPRPDPARHARRPGGRAVARPAGDPGQGRGLRDQRLPGVGRGQPVRRLLQVPVARPGRQRGVAPAHHDAGDRRHGHAVRPAHRGGPADLPADRVPAPGELLHAGHRGAAGGVPALPAGRAVGRRAGDRDPRHGPLDPSRPARDPGGSHRDRRGPAAAATAGESPPGAAPAPSAAGDPRRGGGGAGPPQTVPAVLRVQGLSKSFGGVAAVRDVSFEVPAGSLTALIGPNGAGKSTLFNLITNLYQPDAGEVRLHGRPLGRLAPERITSLGLFRTFQTARVFPQLSVLDNVLVGAYRLGRAGYLAQALRLPHSLRGGTVARGARPSAAWAHRPGRPGRSSAPRCCRSPRRSTWSWPGR